MDPDDTEICTFAPASATIAVINKTEAKQQEAFLMILDQ